MPPEYRIGRLVQALQWTRAPQAHPPLNPIKHPEPFDHPAYLYELKHDGFRAPTYFEDGRCELVSRKDNVYQRFQQLRVDLAAELQVHDAILDGEIVCLDEDGRSQFYDLMFRRSQPYFSPSICCGWMV